jgi:hypothetical protein
MKTNSSDKTESRWQKTPVANLARHFQSGNDYARIRVRGKLIWKSLKTNRISVAKLRLGDFHKEERQRAAAQTAVARGKMTFADALQTYCERLRGNPSLKDSRATQKQSANTKKQNPFGVQSPRPTRVHSRATHARRGQQRQKRSRVRFGHIHVSFRARMANRRANSS